MLGGMSDEQAAKLDRQSSHLSLREQLVSRLQSLRGTRGKERKKSQDDAPSQSERSGPTIMSPRSREGRDAQLKFFLISADFHQDT